MRVFYSGGDNQVLLIIIFLHSSATLVVLIKERIISLYRDHRGGEKMYGLVFLKPLAACEENWGFLVLLGILGLLALIAFLMGMVGGRGN